MIFKKLKYLISIIISVYLFAQIGENIYISSNYLNIVKDKSLLFFFFNNCFHANFLFVNNKTNIFSESFKKNKLY